jgi:L-lactate dehydrogenase complex protein LldF
MNHCPVYARIGGLAYGTTYPGPIGSIVSPHMLGLEATKEQVTASSLCGACSEVCPVGIPIPSQFIRLREVAKSEPPASGPVLVGQGAALDWREKFAWTAWSRIYASPTLYRLFAWAATRFRALTPPWQGGWTAHRTPLRPAVRSLREQLAARRKK